LTGTTFSRKTVPTSLARRYYIAKISLPSV
jgi:hypothetical protein